MHDIVAEGDVVHHSLPHIFMELAREEQQMWTELKNEPRLSGMSYTAMSLALCAFFKRG